MERKMDFKNKRVTIIGLADSGFSAAKLLKALKAKVRISESKDTPEVRERLSLLGGIEYEVGGHTRQFITNTDIMVISPGVPLNAECVRWARQNKIPVIGELELGSLFCRAPIIAVTGTNGKSTTSTLIHEILKANNIKSFLLGNIGTPICEEALKVKGNSVVSVEVSSFQLEAIKKFRPKVAVYLNLTEDHLDRYRDMAEYRKAKSRLFENQKRTDYAVLNYDDSAVRMLGKKINSKVFYFSMKEKVRGIYLDGEKVMLNLAKTPEEICRRSDITLAGRHNVENALASILAVKLIKKDAKMLPVLTDFAGLRHRFELVAESGGVKYIDDSKSTTVDSTIKALNSLSGAVILIAGGRDKGSDYSPVRKCADKLKCIILMGEARNKIRKDLEGLLMPIREARTMKDAVSLARQMSIEGDAVLLSPMCSSFDMFRDYKERGEVFNAAVLDELYRIPEPVPLSSR
ncbi:MAG: UDP-N-acetylmuramoyl-L-alanine--D-glutamate ligase [Candidatus Omnitrophica bacterium]|nr:UDP-N-acetylmuramoyl-L-alanine--D-glutamate ligase [Candidatus Omnitrophota bacterium]MCG2705896.1 UDP-N-acetylmuramoyl-L-alanine--D-glutamate ligase [Candidatus Omnitrophota bacterium]